MSEKAKKRQKVDYQLSGAEVGTRSDYQLAQESFEGDKYSKNSMQ